MDACLIAALVLILYLLVKELRNAVYARGGAAVGACSHECVAESLLCPFLLFVFNVYIANLIGLALFFVHHHGVVRGSESIFSHAFGSWRQQSPMRLLGLRLYKTYVQVPNSLGGPVTGLRSHPHAIALGKSGPLFPSPSGLHAEAKSPLEAPGVGRGTVQDWEEGLKQHLKLHSSFIDGWETCRPAALILPCVPCHLCWRSVKLHRFKLILWRVRLYRLLVIFHMTTATSFSPFRWCATKSEDVWTHLMHHPCPCFPAPGLS